MFHTYIRTACTYIRTYVHEYICPMNIQGEPSTYVCRYRLTSLTGSCSLKTFSLSKLLSSGGDVMEDGSLLELMLTLFISHGDEAVWGVLT